MAAPYDNDERTRIHSTSADYYSIPWNEEFGKGGIHKPHIDKIRNFSCEFTEEV